MKAIGGLALFAAGMVVPGFCWQGIAFAGPAVFIGTLLSPLYPIWLVLKLILG